jgi:hypothetical protein
MSASEFLNQMAPFGNCLTLLLYELARIPRPFLPSSDSKFRLTESGIYINHNTSNETLTYERKF